MATRGFETVTESDIRRINETRGENRQAHAPPLLGRSMEPYLASAQKPAKPHKYRAIPCIVTADLTLFTRDDIVQAAAASGRTIEQLPLKTLAQQQGIIGEWFGSTKEAKRWIELKRLEAADRIRGLRRQVTYHLVVNGIVIGRWIADFEYVERDENLHDIFCAIVREDSKGIRTPLYRRTKAHVEAQYGWKIRET